MIFDTNLVIHHIRKNATLPAATALFFDIELHSTNKDFDHLLDFGLQLIKS